MKWTSVPGCHHRPQVLCSLVLDYPFVSAARSYILRCAMRIYVSDHSTVSSIQHLNAARLRACFHYCSSFVASAAISSTFSSVHSHAFKHCSLGNINNAVYYQYFASAVNNFMVSQSCTDFRNLKAIDCGNSLKYQSVISDFTISNFETSCQFHSSLPFSQTVHVRCSIQLWSSRSTAYRLAVFASDSSVTWACGRFVHVYCDAGRCARICLTKRKFTISQFRANLFGL